MTNKDFRSIIWELTNASTLQDATEPLLSSLSAMSGLECVFLTRIGRHRRNQRVLFSHCPDAASEAITVPPGFTTAWDESLCKLAHDANVYYTMTAERFWPDHPLTRDLGVRTFMSQPIVDRNTTTVGTLCAASGRRVPMAIDTLPTLRLFATLIGGDLEQRRVLAAHREQHEERSTRVLEEALDEMSDNGLLLRSALGRACGVPEHKSVLED